MSRVRRRGLLAAVLVAGVLAVLPGALTQPAGTAPAAVSAAPAAAAPAAAGRPNIVVVMADDMRVDDLVTHLNGQQIVNAQEALNRVAAMSPGSVLEIRGLRGRQPLRIEATLEERPPRGSR